MRLLFLLADAPPHLDYDQSDHYAVTMRAAAGAGIKIYPVASSGLDASGEYIFRQLAQFTGGRYLFLTDDNTAVSGEDGDGAPGDGYRVGVLDEIIVRLIGEELANLVPR